MSEATGPSSPIPWPPLVATAGIVAAVLLQTLYPSGWIGEPVSDILFALGWIGVAVTILLYVTTMLALNRAGTTVLPTRASTHLVTSGPFAFSRNPIYLANVVLIVAIGLVSGSAWFLGAALAVGSATAWLAIRPEERHLEARFGKKYRDYKSRVGRWF